MENISKLIAVEDTAIVRVMEDRKEEIDRFIKSEKLDLKSDEDLVRLVDFMMD